MSRDDSFDHMNKASARFFTHPRFFAGATIGIALVALIVTLGAILQPMPAPTRVTLIVAVAVLWIFTLTWFNQGLTVFWLVPAQQECNGLAAW